MKLLEKKRSVMLILFLACIFIFSTAVAGRTQEFNDKVLSGESIDIDDFTFIITMNKYASAIFVDAGKMFQTVQLYDCKKMEHFQVCFDNTTYDYEENELYALVRIFRYKPALTITRTINDTELYAGQEAEVTITISNKGDTASQIIMTDDYPKEIEIYDLEGGCNEHENQVYWKGHLDGNRSKECRFIIRGTEEIHQSLVAHLKYWDGFKWVDEYSAALTIDIEKLLTIESRIVREDYEVDKQTFDFEEENPGVNIGETLRLIVNITNNHDEDTVDVEKFEISLPPDLEYKSTSYLRFNYLNASGNRTGSAWHSDKITKISDRTLRWKGRVTINKSKSFIIKLKAKRSGNQNVLMQVKYEYDDLEFADTPYESFEVSDPGIAIRMTVLDTAKRFSAPERLNEDDDTIDLEALHPYKVTVYAQNRNKYSELKDVDVWVITEIAYFKKVHYAEVAEEGQRIPYSLVLIPPNAAGIKKFNMNVSASYTNDFGESGDNSTEFEITVEPAKDLIIAVDSSEGLVLEGGEETEISVSVTNDRLVDIKGVKVKDVIDNRLHVEGVHSKTLKLLSDEETNVYKYRVKPPIVHNKTKYNITTTVIFFDPDTRHTFNFTKTTIITVKPLQPDLSIDVSYDKPDDIYPGSLIPVEYAIKNEEDLEIIRGVMIYFPIQDELDFIGPKTFSIDKLDPGEEFTIKNLIKIRPKIAKQDMEVNSTRVEYYDNYGNLFDENSSTETIDVDAGQINGPAIFLRTAAPAVFNTSAEGVIELKIINNGSAPIDLAVEQGGKMWNKSVGAYSTKTIKYTMKYDAEGNYTIPDPIASFKFQGVDAYTKGTGTSLAVKLLLGPEDIVEEKKVVVEKAKVVEKEKEEISFVEYEAKANEQMVKRIIRYSIVGLVVIIFFAVVLFYIGYQRRKAPTEPFMEAEK